MKEFKMLCDELGYGVVNEGGAVVLGGFWVRYTDGKFHITRGNKTVVRGSARFAVSYIENNF